MMKKILLVLALMVFLLPQAALAENLIQNPGFEEVSGGLPLGWQRDMWDTGEGVSYLTAETDAFSGAYSAKVENLSDNDARFRQTVRVEPGAMYLITCRIMAQGVGQGEDGAGISIGDTFASSEFLYDTFGEWVPVELYGIAGENQTELTVMARLGGYSSTNTGTAWFDDFSMKKADFAPAGATVYDFTTLAEDVGEEDVDFSEGEEDAGGAYTKLMLLVAALSLAIMALGAWGGGRGALDGLSEAALRRLLWAAVAAGFAIRAVVAVTIYGYGVDMGDFAAWGARMTVTGPSGFYAAGVFCDYPPGYMYALWAIGDLRSFLGLSYDSPLFWLILKMPAILMDLAAAVLIYTEGKKALGQRIAVLLGVLYALLPAAIMNSAAWGQIDSILAILLAMSLIKLSKGRYAASLIFYGVAIMVKPFALALAPLGLAALAVEVYRSERRSKTALHILRAVGLMLLVMLVIALPFMTNLPADLLQKSELAASAPGFLKPMAWLTSLFTGSTDTYPYITVNAANLYVLLDMNWRSLEGAGLWSLFANIMMYLSFGYAMTLYFMSKRRERLPLVAATLLALLFAFGPMMHERYLFPAILLLGLAYIHDQDVRILAAAFLITATQFMNSGLVLQSDHLIDAERTVNVLVSATNVLTSLFLAWTAFDICVKNRVLSPTRTYLSEEDRRLLLDPMINPAADGLFRPKEWKLGMKKRDWLLMLGLTLVYSVVALTNLGALEAPQTSWRSTAEGEQITFDLGNLRTFHMTYYGGICDTAFTVQLSEDGEVWSEPHWAVYNQGEIFRWLWYVPSSHDEEGEFSALESGHPTQTARFVRIAADEAGLILSEIAFLDDGGVPYPISSVYASGADPGRASDPTLLIDEQETVPPYPSYLNGTYFDEIYHARTAFEHREGLHTYEYTHPPLGKVLIMVGINLFGMTPFGWRFMGALFGILMIPAMYLLAKQLLRRSSPAFLAAFLMAVDGMHFTQTRIATIDVFGVFFIIVMYVFMLRYLMMSFNHTRLWRTLVPLFFSGLFMGFAIASKWIGIYAGAGLAVLFFYSVHLRAREYRFAKANLKLLDGEQKRVAQRAVKQFGRNMWVTLAWCVVFFIAVPATIYYFSYYWQLTPDGTFNLNGVWDMQKSMFSYHAGLTGDTHFFRSPWYEWPLIVRPIWYYSGADFMPSGWISSIYSMGNPAVWWGGFLALIFVIIRLCGKAFGDRRYIFVVVGFLSQYLPWTLITRSTFIYHYFASVPFIILATAVFFEWLRREKHEIYVRAVWIYGGLALILFAMFYPLMSGTPFPRVFANLLNGFRWFYLG